MMQPLLFQKEFLPAGSVIDHSAAYRIRYGIVDLPVPVGIHIHPVSVVVEDGDAAVTGVIPVGAVQIVGEAGTVIVEGGVVSVRIVNIVLQMAILVIGITAV